MEKVRLDAGAEREWTALLKRKHQPVLLLRHRSFWGDRVAGLSLRTANNRTITAWFLLCGNNRTHWRRMRVRYWFP